MTTQTTRAAADRDVALGLLRDMLRIRRFEEKCAELYSAGRIRGFLHLYIGEEAVAVGSMRALSPDDAVVATYREHGHALARGIDSGRLMAEMFGKQEGCSRGRGGSMHVFDAATRFDGGNAIVGGGLPIAVGLALADALSRRPRVTACHFGEGAVAEGEFHESLNLAALWKLPVLFACENNLYAMGTRIERALSQTEVASKARVFGIPAVAVDGMDVQAVQEAAREAVEAIRAGGGPRLLEFLTYRFRAHSMFDPELYRDVGGAPAAVLPGPAPGPPSGSVPAAAGRPHRASPAARKAAEVLHVDLARVAGSGPGGAVTREDVERAAAGREEAPAAPGAPAPGTPAPMRRAIGAAMARSKREIPHLYRSSTIDVSSALGWLAGANERRPVERRLLPVAMLVKAVAAAAREVPGLNGFWTDEASTPLPGSTWAVRSRSATEAWSRPRFTMRIRRISTRS